MAKGKTTKITATSRAAVKIGDNYFTVEATEEREIPEDMDLNEEWLSIFDSVNGIIDTQAEDIYKANKRR